MSWTLGFEAGANGDAVTTTNTGADGLFTTGGTGVISTGQAFAGTRSVLLTNSTANGILCLVKNLTTSGVLTLDLYFYWTALPSAESTLVRVLDTGSATCWSVNTDSTGHVRYRDAAGTLVAISSAGATSMSTGQWSHLKITATAGATAGTMRVQYFVGSSTTASYDTAVLTGQNTGANWGAVRLGTKAATATATGTAYLDAVTGDESTVTSSGSVTAPSAAASESAFGPTLDAQTSVTGGGPATATAKAFAPSAGSSGAGVSPPPATATGKAGVPKVGNAPLLSAVPDPTNSPPRVILTVGAASGSTVTITRTDVSGNVASVRSANPATLAAGGWVGFDYECPFNQSVVYTATTDVSATAALTTTVSLDVSQPWLIDPGIPSRSVPLTIQALGDTVRDTNQGVHRPLGRESAVVITDGRRQSPTFELTLLTSGPAEESALTALLDAAQTLLLQIAYPGMTRTQYSWVSVGATTKSRLAPLWQCEDFTWTLPCTSSSRPAGLLQAQFQWPDLVAEEASWVTVKADFATWRDVLIHAAGS